MATKQTKIKGKKGKKPSGENGEKTTLWKPTYLDASGVQDPLLLQEFVFWCALFKEHRDPPTQEEFRVKFKIGKNTLMRWKLLTGFWEEVQYLKKNFARHHTEGVIKNLVRRGKVGDSRDIKLYLQYFEDFQETKKIVTKDDPLTPEEDREYQNALKLKKLDKKQIALLAGIEEDDA